MVPVGVTMWSLHGGGDKKLDPTGITLMKEVLQVCVDGRVGWDRDIDMVQRVCEWIGAGISLGMAQPMRDDVTL